MVSNNSSMWFFKKKQTIGSSGFLSGWTDYHCHILPKVDDGFQNVNDSLEALRRYEELGVSEVWLTPHTMEDIPNTTADLQQKFEEFRKAYNPDDDPSRIRLHLASEYMLDNKFEQHLEEKDFLTLGDMRTQVLVETSYLTPPADFIDKLMRLKQAGYFPVLAHPERYVYMDDNDYRQLKSMDVWFQLNLASLGGGYGKAVMKKAERMLRLGYYDLHGSDLHRLTTLNSIIDIPIPEELLMNE